MLFWLGAYLVIIDQLAYLGVSSFVGQWIAHPLRGLAPIPAAIVLSIWYFLLVFAFASLSTHPLAFAGFFMVAGEQLGCPKRLIMALLSYFTALGCCVNNFSTGVYNIYVRLGHAERKGWLVSGFLVGLLHMGVHFTVGLGWWKLLGWF